MSWKTQALNSVRVQTAPAVSSDAELAADLRAKLEANEVPAHSLSFAQSLLSGFAKYGSFSDKQRPHVQKLAGTPGAAPVASPVAGPDAPIAAALRAALPQLALRDVDFAQSLLAGFEKYGSFSERQRPYAQKFAAQGAPAAIVPQPVVSPVPMVSPAQIVSQAILAFPRTVALFGPNKFARFDGAAISLRAKNDFSVVWVKTGDILVGRLLPDGTYLPRSPHYPEVAKELAKIEANPKEYASARGLLTGTCCCCGRALTDPVSIANGIGPICASRF